MASITALLAIAVGLLALIGWQLDLDALKRVLPGRVSMNPMTALCFIAAGASLFLSTRCGRHARLRPAAAALAVAVALVGAAKIASILGGWPFAIDRILFADRLTEAATAYPNRMAPNTALCFVLSGIALLSLVRPDRRGVPAAQAIALGPCLLSFLAIVGYAFSAAGFYGVASFIPMALNTAATFGALGAGILLAEPRVGLMAPIAAPNAGGSASRRLLPFAIGVPVFLGWLSLRGEAMGMYGHESTYSLAVASGVVASAVFIWIIARSLGRSDTARRSAAAALANANGSLERRVAERTAELHQAIVTLEAEIEERKRAEAALRQSEEQLRQSQKMEAVGLLAGGVAHDFNNLLTAILGYSELTKQKLRLDDPARRDTEEIERAAVRAASLTRQLLAFSRQQILQPKVLDLNAVLADMDRMLARLLPASIDFVAESAPDLGRVKADPGQVEQVILNLVVNARDAMPNGGTLTIETANVSVDSSYARGRHALPSGAYVLLAVSDSGHGMDEATRSRIFEPFFTTKSVGKGTGLGLSTVHGIVRQSGGHIEVYSEPGVGAAFKVYLPRVEEALDAAEASGLAPPETRGTETVLLVEDEELVRSVVRETLGANGYRVIEAANGEEGLAIHAERIGRIDLLLTDVVMPRVGGPELARQIASRDPELRILFMSGYTDRAIVHQGILKPGTEFLQKPFTAATLLRKVRAVLDSPRSAPSGAAAPHRTATRR